MRYADSRIIIFAKAPVPGTVKTRLIPELGVEKATQLYEAMVVNAVSMAVESGLCPVQLWCAPDCEHAFYRHLNRDFGVSLHAQHGKDLGERMYNAFSTALEASAHAVIIGSDCPVLNTQLLADALEALHSGSQAAIAPAADGGYVLLGLNRNDRALFEGLAWGEGTVYAGTLEKLRRLSFSYVSLAQQWDVDRIPDVQRCKRLLESLRLHQDLESVLADL
jgi:rSAM/selenodomain-associated transferase 1